MKTVFKFHKNKKVYECYSDGGHGWLKVTRTELQRLKIMDKISGFSYQKKGNVFLEEDIDAGIFIDAKKSIDGIEIKFNSHYSNHSRIRNYYGFSFDLVDSCLRDIVRAQN